MASEPSIVRHTEVEHETIAHIRDAVRDAINNPAEGTEDLSRKISSVRFVAQSFQRYLERMLALEEHDGYMAVICETRPNFETKVQALRQDHERFRSQIRQIIPGLERVTAQQPDVFSSICSALLELVNGVTKHNAKEATLLHEALIQDVGGEG